MRERKKEMLNKIFILILVTLIPFFELRASIPLGILSGTVNLPFGLTLSGFAMNILLVYFICVVTNILLGIVLFQILNWIPKFIHHVKWLDKLYKKILIRGQKRIKPYVEKYGFWGLAIFVAVPLPGSGSYTGALGAFVLGISAKEFFKANTVGVIIAGIAVTLITLGARFVF